VKGNLAALPGLPDGGRVLAVDDQPENLELVAAILSDEGMRVVLAADGQTALDIVAADPPDCIVLDVMMPRMNGLEVCRRLKGSRRTRSIPVVMLTALSSVDDRIAAFDAGADDFLSKPVHVNELATRVRSLVRIKRLHDELDTSESIIVSMIQALESKDPRHAGHSRRVAGRAVRLARRLGLGGREVETVGKGALLHDLGKIGVAERLLGASELEGIDLEQYRLHPLLGEQILAPLRSFAAVRSVIRHHHERLDGRGYPDRLGGGELDVATQVVALANHYDHAASEHGARAGDALRAAAARGELRRELVEEALATELDLDDSHARLPLEVWMDRLPVAAERHAGRILVADRSEGNRELLRGLLAEAGHEVVAAACGDAVRRALEESRPDLVLLAVELPDVDGFELCRALKERPELQFLPIVLVTPEGALRDRTLSARAGADDFLTYPIHRLELVARVQSLLRLRFFFRELEEYQSVILSLASALEAKDRYTRGHSERVGFLASLVGRRLGLPDPECEMLLVGGLLHDIGKIGVPEGLLNKPGRLTEEELRRVMAHPVLGEEICRPLRSTQQALPMIRHHHERYDGSGYPDRLAGQAIPFGARILGVVDAYDALTSIRSYRQCLSSADALGVLEHETEVGRWDLDVVRALRAVLVGAPREG
jgi:putative two-component system response regulator